MTDTNTNPNVIKAPQGLINQTEEFHKQSIISTNVQ
jgi:hypothetical protein